MRPQSRAPAARGAGTLVLLVDPDQPAREIRAALLRLVYGEVDEAADGPEALAKAIARQPDVIVTETDLPGIDGLQLCALLRRDDATRTIPVLVITGDAGPDTARHAREVGADSVLHKPCGPDAVLAEVRRLTDDPQSLPPDVALRPIAPGDVVDANLHEGKRSLTKAHLRRDTTAPPLTPPLLRCPHCDRPLAYEHSHVGGVSAKQSEQWDYYECSAGCGRFQYRQRTRKLRRLS